MDADFANAQGCNQISNTQIYMNLSLTSEL